MARKSSRSTIKTWDISLINKIKDRIQSKIQNIDLISKIKLIYPTTKIKDSLLIKTKNIIKILLIKNFILTIKIKDTFLAMRTKDKIS